MAKKGWMVVVMVLLIPGVLMITACQQVKPEKQPAAPTEPSPDQPIAQPEPQPEPAPTPEPADPCLTRMQAVHVHFAFDSSVLDETARGILNQKAACLRQHPGTSVIIEGHCDERGTNEYNMALGDRRANSVMDYLKTMGIEEARMVPVSYGEEQPLDMGHDEAAWAKNRRAQFKFQ